MTKRVPAVSFRPIRDDDKPFLCKLYASTREYEMQILSWTPEEKESFLEQQFNAQYVYYAEQFPRGDFRVILRGEEPIGRLYLDYRDDEIRLVDIALLPEHRNEGIGGALVQDVIQSAGREGKAVRIHVENNNPAMSLYLRLGFKHIDTNGVYHLMEWAQSN